MRKISRRSFIKAATFTAAAAALTACGGSSSSTTTASSTAASAAADNTPSNKGTGVTLTVYTNSETDGRDEWLIERAAQDGFKVQVVGAGAADTQNRLLAEKASPIADVVFGLNAIIWESLKAENILIPFVPEWADEIPAGLNDDEGYYHAIVKQAILLVYDQNQLTEDQAPTDWPDLWTKPEFDKKYEYLTSLAGGTVRNVIAGILTRYADPNGDLGIAQEGWDAIAEYYKHGVPNEDGVDLYAQMRSVDFQTVEAAQNMGASQFRILTKVVLPVLTPSLMAVTILTFITGLSATSAPLLVGGQGFQTITPMILTFANNVSSRPLAALLALFLGVATIILLTIMIQIEKRGHYMSVSKVKTTIVKQKIRNPILNVLAHVYAYLLFLIYVIPVALVVLFSFTDSATIASKHLTLSSFTLDNYISIFQKASSYKPFVVSIAYSAIAASFVAIIVLIACRILQKRKDRLGGALEYGLLIPWLLPTTLMALGLITTYNTPRIWMFNKVLTGTSVIMLIGYIIIKIPFTLRMTKAAFFSLDDSLEDAARNMGAKPFYTFMRVQLPIILPTVLAIFALNFNGLLGDYDMSVFMYHPLNKPLGVYIKSLTDAETNADNAALTFVYAVLMMVISAAVMYLVYGRGNKVDKSKD